MATLLDRRFLVLSGKGGVGRTTVAVVLARAAASRGRRVLLAQMDSPERLGRLLGHPGTIGASITNVGEGVDAVNMTPRESIHEYALMVLRYESLYRALFDNTAVRGFLNAIPGLDAYSMLGKAWWHTTEQNKGADRYDLVILDGPASGHITPMFQIPRAIVETMPKGPLARDAAAMLDLFADPARAAFIIVTLPEELPARETSVLARTVRESLRMPLGPLIVNGLPPPHGTEPAASRLLERLGAPTGDADLDATVEGTALLAERRRAAERIVAGLAQDPGLPIIALPRLPTTDLGPAEVDLLVEELYSRITSS